MKRAVWGLAVVSVLVSLASIPFAIVSKEDLFGDFVIAIVLGSIAMVLVGALIATRIPGNAMGWIYLAAGTIYAFVSLGQSYARWAFTVAHRPLPLVGLATWWAYWAWLTAFTLFAALGFLLFPNGKPPSRRWRPLVWLCWTSVVATSFNGIAALGTDPARLWVFESGSAQGPTNIVGTISQGIFPLLVLASAVSLVVRYIHSNGDQRRQIAWFVLAAVAMVVTFAITPNGGNIVSAITVPAVPIAAGIGILKYRLYDIDIVVRKTVVIGLTAGFITLVYVAIVAGVGALVGQQGNTTLSAAAAAVVALAFLPVRQRARHVADRVVYGKRATPYETLTEFAGNAANTLAVEEVLPQMAQALGDGTGASLAEVWLLVGNAMEREGLWPLDAGEPAEQLSVPIANGNLPEFPSAQRTTAVRYQNQLLGALTLSKPASDPITPADEKLMDDLAEQAGLVLRNARLVEELRASRQRLVAAQDEERRKIERNLHDGAQQQLIALAIKVNLAQSLASKEGEKAAAMMGDVKAELQDAVDTLRDLARGIYPPLLADQGLAVALDAQAKKAAVPTKVDAYGLSRYPQEIEAAVYFCTLEALQNVAKYANATHARVHLSANDGHLEFEITDDGAGFDTSSTNFGTGMQGMADRLAAIGGTLTVASEVGKGTTVIGRVSA